MSQVIKKVVVKNYPEGYCVGLEYNSSVLRASGYMNRAEARQCALGSSIEFLGRQARMYHQFLNVEGIERSIIA